MVSTSNFVFVPSLYSIYLSIITVSIPMNGLDVLNPRPAAPPAHTQDARRRMGQGDWRWYQLPRPTPVLYVRSQLLVLSLPNSAPVHAKVSALRSLPHRAHRIIHCVARHRQCHYAPACLWSSTTASFGRLRTAPSTARPLLPPYARSSPLEPRHLLRPNQLHDQLTAARTAASNERG